jgi:hypothetical protein
MANAVEMCGCEDAVEVLVTPLGHELAEYPTPVSQLACHHPQPGQTKSQNSCAARSGKGAYHLSY